MTRTDPPPGRRLVRAASPGYLEAALWRSVQSHRELDPLSQIILVLPSYILGQHLLRTLAGQQPVVWNIKPTTFPDLAEGVAIERLVEINGRLMTPMVDFLLTRRLVSLAVKSDGYFGPISGFPSTPRTILASLTDLKHAGVTATELESIAPYGVPQGKRPSDAHTLGKLAAVAELCRAREQLKTEALLMDTADLLGLAVEEAARSRFLSGVSSIVLYGFSDLNTLERRLFAACAEGRPASAFILEDAAGFTNGLANWLVSLGFHAEQGEIREATPRLAVAAFAERLFREETHDGMITADMRIISAPGVEEEAREIARHLLAVTATQGISFSDIAVLTRNLSEYERTLRDVFYAAGIPHVVLDGFPASDTLAGRFLRLLMRIRLSDYPRPDTMEFLSLAPVRPELLRAFPEASAPDWDRYSREAGIVGGLDHWRRIHDTRRRVEWRIQRLQKDTVGSVDQATLAVLQRDLGSLSVFERVLSLLLKRLKSIPDEASVAELLGGFIRALVSVVRLGDEDRLIVKSLAGITQESVADEVVTLPTFETLLDDLLTERIPPADVYRSGRVVVSSLRAAFGLSFKVIFIPGLVERSFPPPPRQDPIVLDHEREMPHKTFGAELTTRERRSDPQIVTDATEAGAQRR